MTSSTDAAPTPRERTYGNWRRPYKPGLGRLGLIPTIGLFILLAIVAVVGPNNAKAAIIVLVVGLALLTPTAIRDRYGRHLGMRLQARVAWMNGVARGQNIYQSGPLSKVPGGRFLLPGLAADTNVYEGRDGLGRPFVMLHFRKINHFSTVVQCNAQGGSLVDKEDVDTWVANWGDYMRRMGNEPSLLGFQVVVETAPDSGEKLRREIAGQRDRSASPFANSVMNSIEQTYPNGSPTVRTFVAYCYDGATHLGKRTRTPEEMGVLIAQRLPQLTEWLAATGAGTARPLTHTDLAETVRMAYEPAIAPLIDKARSEGGSGLTWDKVGPKAAHATWRDYRHDGARSITWVMGEAPRGEVFSNVLTDLLRPHPSIDRKRVAIIYRPHSPAEAAGLVESDTRAAGAGVDGARSDKSRKRAELRAAQRTAQEEAEGAGLTRFGLVATATVVDDGTDADADRLQLADVAMENLSAPSRIALRRAYGSQDADFLAALPLGVLLPEHLTLKLPDT
ncbi:MAG TPA: SCO6880 family protein [Streptosporangiales bacterium]